MMRWLPVAAVAAVMVATVPASAQVADEIDCLGPVEVAESGTEAYRQQQAENVYCSQQRHLDKPAHPNNFLPLDEPGADAYRDPALHDDVRFRFDTTTIAGMPAEVYRPCAADTCLTMPDELTTYEPPYPAVVIYHGGATSKELHWWSSQVLAEAGYLVVAADGSGRSFTREEADAVLTWLHDPATGLAADYDGETLGLAGHSVGGVMVSRLGQEDPRVDAVVSWDRAQHTVQPDDVPWHAPVLYFFADYNCQQVPVCQPDPPSDTPPADPTGPGDKGRDFELARAAGVDTMQLALRASLHLDWIPSDLSGNRWAEPVTLFHTRAWFDRYLRGTDDPTVAADAFARLTATTFDDSVDVHALSQGIYDPALAAAAGDPLAGNQPYLLEGLPTADRLSFLYLSRCSITGPGPDGVLVESDDVRTSRCVAATAEPDDANADADADAAVDVDDADGADDATEGELDSSVLPATGGSGGGAFAISLVLLGCAAAILRRRRA